MESPLVRMAALALVVMTIIAVVVFWPEPPAAPPSSPPQEELTPLVRRSAHSSLDKEFSLPGSEDPPPSRAWKQVQPSTAILAAAPSTGTMEAVPGETAARTGIEGSVVDNKGRPVAGVRVIAERLSDDGQPAQSNRGPETASDGRFEFLRLAAGEYIVKVKEPASLHWVEESVSVREGVVAKVVLRLPHRDERIAGVVVDDAGNPVKNVSLVLKETSERPHTEAGSDFSGPGGRFEFTGLGPGTFRLNAAADGYMPVEYSGLRAGETNLKITLPAAGIIQGRVRALDGTIPPLYTIRYFVEAAPPQARDGHAMSFQNQRGQQDFANPDGSFELRNLVAGQYSLMAAADGMTGRLPVHVEVKRGSRVTGVEILLDSGAEVSGKVLDEKTGKPVKGARVIARYVPPNLRGGFGRGRSLRLGAGETGPDGHYVLPHVPAGDASLLVFADGYLPKSVDLQIPERTRRQFAPDILLLAGDFRGMMREQRFGGVGASLSVSDGIPTIAGLVPGGPAFRAGVAKGDKVLSVDGMATTGRQLYEIIARIRGPERTTVVLGLDRGGRRWNQAIVRDIIDSQNTPPQ
ncbi:MAG: hypothetical protein GMKNLPBB_01158 [Myxococcota bacterium]|nr:hypothetical protein [Myxococcota bacterium]